MLIKTFKFIVKDINASTSKYDNIIAKNKGRDTSAAFIGLPLDTNAKNKIIHKRIKKGEVSAFNNLNKINGEKYKQGDLYPITDHINFMMSSSFSTQIVAKYIDAITTKYEIPKDEWPDRIKVKTTTGVDNKTGMPYIIYVCMFCDVSYTGDISIKEFLNHKNEEESPYSDEFGEVVYYKVKGNLQISTPTVSQNAITPSDPTTPFNINVYISSYRSSGSLYKKYVLVCQSGKEIYSFNSVKEINIDTNEISTTTTSIEVPSKGSVEFKIDNIELANQHVFNQITAYKSVEISNLSPKNEICELQNDIYLVIKDNIKLESNQ